MSRTYSDYPRGFVETGTKYIATDFRNGEISFFLMDKPERSSRQYVGKIRWTGKSWCGKVNGKVVKAGPYLDTALGRAMFNFVGETNV